MYDFKVNSIGIFILVYINLTVLYKNKKKVGRRYDMKHKN